MKGRCRVLIEHAARAQKKVGQKKAQRELGLGMCNGVGEELPFNQSNTTVYAVKQVGLESSPASEFRPPVLLLLGWDQKRERFQTPLVGVKPFSILESDPWSVNHGVALWNWKTKVGLFQRNHLLSVPTGTPKGW